MTAPGHCRGCACHQFAHDVVTVELSGRLLAELQRQGWSNPIRVAVRLVPGTGRWEMIVQTDSWLVGHLQ